MAFTYTGGAENGGNTGTTASITHGQTINNGDTVVMYVNSNSTSAMSADAGGSTWIEAVDEQPASETARQGLWWKVAGSSEPSSYSVSIGSGFWRIMVKVFQSTNPAVVDSAAATHIQGSNSASLVCGAANGAVISNNALSIICGGKDNRKSADTYTTADNSYTGVLADHNNQDSGMVHRIYTTGTTFSGNITVSATSLSDKTYSAHISFIEGTGGGGVVIPVIVNHLKNQGVM